MGMYYRVILSICKVYAVVAYNLKYRGTENLLQDENYILCSNHKSFIDPIFVGIATKKELSFMAKEELFKKPILGSIIRKLGAFPVGRGKNDLNAIGMAKQVVADGKVFSIFPEGTRSKTDNLLKFKSGAALVASQTGAKIVPVCIWFTGKLRFRKKVIIRFGKPIENSELGVIAGERSNIKEATRLLQSRVEALKQQSQAEY